MTELELKAHVDDRAAIARRLDTFARRGQHVIRDDDYWGKAADDRHKIRIRRETFIAPDGGIEKTDILVTYKRKSRIKGADGVEAEANDEKECTVSDAAVLEAFLTDTGYAVQLKKRKDVEDWHVALPAGAGGGTGPLQATLELCAVERLGDFLELEILSPTDDAAVLSSLHGELERLLEQAGIPKDRIENRYYSELLRDAAPRT
jgi:adenylate cyclase class 2